MKTIKSLVALAQAVERGDKIEWLAFNKWQDVSYTGINFGGAIECIEEGRFRIKPALKKIDLSGLVGSGVLCEFSNAEFDDLGSNQIGLLSGIEAEGFAEIGADGGDFWPNCRPLFNHPHVNTSDRCQIPKGFVYSVKLESGATISNAQRGAWEVKWPNVVHYTITGIAEGYERNGKG